MGYTDRTMIERVMDADCRHQCRGKAEGLWIGESVESNEKRTGQRVLYLQRRSK